MGEKGTRGEYWIKHYAIGAPGGTIPGFKHGPEDPDHAFNPDTGQNAHWDDEKQQWIDSKTGTPLSPSALDPQKR